MLLPDSLTIEHPFRFELIRIPEGEFTMGSDPALDREASENEQPQHRIFIPEFYISKYPITNEQYKFFVDEWGCNPPKFWINSLMFEVKVNNPVVEVNLYAVRAFCQWLRQATGMQFRIPTEAEWEKAARGEDGRIYPWGNDWDAQACNHKDSWSVGTTPVWEYEKGVSPYGVVDMLGNVCEWTSSLWGEDLDEPDFKYPYDPQDGREDLGSLMDVCRVIRGGSYINHRKRVRCAVRFAYPPIFESELVGFRVVVSGETVETLERW
ncbi:MAG: SUMF1/EgtB/PvdO family nonheme iron enzyme [Anaerolineales bacterium]|jgi:formylglycine-generating enzyme required for sulfatase activity